MRAERTPEEAARSKRINANVMIVCGAVMAVCGFLGALIVLSGRGDAPDWMFGGRRAAAAPGGTWSNAPSRVAFEDWGRAPFERAQKEGKLVLLFLGPSFSAPTARMASETFGDARAAALVAARFVPVRVRSEDYPDLDRRYRAAGWPVTALLLPDGTALDAGTSMTPDVFLRWAGALADKAATHPELAARAGAEAAARRRESLAARSRGTTPPGAEAAEARARAALLGAWDPAGRTFDGRGPRFPRFERVAALRRIPADWARDLAAQAARGALIFQDGDGGFRRAAAPDGSPSAREKTAAVQAAALDALCVLQPEAAGHVLDFLETDFAPKGGAAWRGWQAGFALDAKRFTASDGPDFERFRAEGWRETGPGRMADEAELSRAVLACPLSDGKLRTRAKRIISRLSTAFAKARRINDERLLLDDAVALGSALLAAGETKKALDVWRWLEANLSGGPAYLDRLATGVLPPEADRVADPALNARALEFARLLASRLPDGADKAPVAKRAEALYFWLSARPESLDPAVWAALAAEEPR